MDDFFLLSCRKQKKVDGNIATDRIMSGKRFALHYGTT
jgi:hypothetical protein